MTNTNLINKIKAGEKDGIANLYDRYAGVMLGVVTRILGDKEASEDTLQEVFVKVWNKIDQYDPQKSKFYTWLINISRYTALDKIKTRHYQHEDKIQSFNPVVHNNNGEGKGEASTPSDLIDVKDHVANLDKEYREVIDMVYFNGYTQNETAKHLNLPLGTVKTRIRKGLKVMRQLYE